MSEHSRANINSVKLATDSQISSRVTEEKNVTIQLVVGPCLRVELFREPGKSLGISIVGGRGMGSRLSNGEVMRGIFIKHILEDSPAGQNGTLKTGDRIVEVKTDFRVDAPPAETLSETPSIFFFLQVDGVDLRDASHEEAVEAIRRAGNPVSFLVQSIIHRPRVSGTHRHSFLTLCPLI